MSPSTTYPHNQNFCLTFICFLGRRKCLTPVCPSEHMLCSRCLCRNVLKVNVFSEYNTIQCCALCEHPSNGLLETNFDHTRRQTDGGWTDKSKVFPHSITSVGHRIDPGFLAVSPQVT